MTARQEKVREAMGLMASAAQSREPYTPQVAAAIAAALAEVEETEARLDTNRTLRQRNHELREELDEAQEALQTLAQDHYFARAEAAEAERDRLKDALEKIVTGRWSNKQTPDWSVRDFARAALGEQT